jgi:hypothetical protein
MARKGSGGSSLPATTEATAAKDGQSASPPSKSDAVKQALSQGMNSPTEIAAHLKSAYGLDITTAHVSTIKGNLKKSKKGKGRKSGRKPRAEKQATEQPAAKPAPVAKVGGLTPQDLRTLTELASPDFSWGSCLE